MTDQIGFVFFGVSVKDWEIWHIGDKRWFSLSLVPQALGCLRLSQAAPPEPPRFLLLKIFIRLIEEITFPSGEFGEKGFCILQSRANGRFHLP